MRLSPNSGRVKVDRGQIEQAILNLVVNARDAMPDGGTRIDPAKERSFSRGHRCGDTRLCSPVLTSELAIQDGGTGIDPIDLSRVFEPFFTTKAPGKGTGLGLSMVIRSCEAEVMERLRWKASRAKARLSEYSCHDVMKEKRPLKISRRNHNNSPALRRFF